MINAEKILNMQQLLSALEIQFENCLLIKYMTEMTVNEMSASCFFRQVRLCADSLKKLGLENKHIGIMGTNRCTWLIHFCAVFLIHSVVVLLSPDLNSEELTARAEQTDLCAILYDDALEESIHSAKLAGILLLSMDQKYPETVSTDKTAEKKEFESRPEDLACILFTSGTTTTNKAVMLSHRSLISSACHNIINRSFKAQLAILPFHHIAGIASVLNTWYLGSVVCLGQDFKYIFRYLEYMKPDYILTVPSLLQAILRRLKRGGSHGQLLGWDLHLIGCGGAKFQPEVIQTLNAQNIQILQSYGATEAGGLGLDWEMTPECQNTLGKPCPEVEIKIVDGELFLRSASVMMGYYKAPAATHEVLKDGWYATGDLCEQDENGYLYLKGRKKNLIILSNGENVSPEEIESKLASACPAIGEVMVGIEQDLITATVFPKDLPGSTPSEREVIENEIKHQLKLYNGSVPSYKQVQNLHFAEQPFAKTEIGKIIRRSVTGANWNDS